MRKQSVPVPSDQKPLPAKPENVNVILAWLEELVRQVRLAWRLYFDPRVPWGLKLILPGALAYLFLPPDIVPDFLLGLGQLDDVAVLLLSTKLFIELSPTEVVREHLRALGAKIGEWPAGEEPPVIEGEFTVEDEAARDVEQEEDTGGEETIAEAAE